MATKLHFLVLISKTFTRLQATLLVLLCTNGEPGWGSQYSD